MSSAAFILAPAAMPPKSDKEKSDKWKELLESLKEYRGGFKKIKKLSRGGSEACLSNRGTMDEFDFGDFSEDELTYLAGLARSFPGDYLALWTYGYAVNILLIQSQKGEEPAVRELSLRLRPSLSGRDKTLFGRFADWFGESAFTPDIDALQAEYDGDGISVQRWFEAFGVEGAKDVEPGTKDHDEWRDFESVSESLLHGEKPDAGVRKRVNALIRDYDDEAALPTTPRKSAGVTARIIGESAYTLEEAVGEPEEPLWKERRRAAHLYWDITDCDAGDRLAGVTDEKNVGAAGSMGRLLAHYPKELMRDGLFHALAGMEAEGANGHAYVESFHSLAENVNEAGFTLAIYPARLMTDFRILNNMQSFGDWTPEGEWTAEAFIDLGGIVKADPAISVAKWFAKKKADGMVLRADADGSYMLDQYKAGVMLDMPDPVLPGGSIADEEALHNAAKALWPPDVFPAIGLPNLLAPGEWSEGAYAGEDDSAARTGGLRDKARVMTGVAPETKPIINPSGIISDYPRMIRNENRLDDEHPVALKIILPEPDAEYHGLLAADLLGHGLLEEYGKTWSDESSVIGISESDMNSAILVRTLGDLPAGTLIIINDGTESFRYLIDPGEHGSEELFLSRAPSGKGAESYDYSDGGDKMVEETIRGIEKIDPDFANDLRRQDGHRRSKARY